jgi:dephospho-CoA kinase
MRITAITGGIGTGKSVVSEILRTMGYPVYDCDSRAKHLMDSDENIKNEIAAQICRDAIDSEGHIDRRRLSEVVFADAEMLRRLNAIVHGAVRNDFIAWTEATDADMVWVETAILYESGFDRLVNAIWEVTAPEHLRIRRVMRRNALTADQVRARIRAQHRPTEQSQSNSHHTEQSNVNADYKRVSIIVNDDVQPMLPQILSLI